MTSPVPVDPTPESDAEAERSASLKRSVPWGAVAGTVLLVYVVIFSLSLTGLDDRAQFNRWGHAMGSIGARIALCGVMVAGLFHGLDGLRRMAIDVRPDLAEQNPRWRATVLFFTWALAIPAMAVIVWPWISATTR